jgi:CDP-diacylglycerol--serine O-phosphatidyltransferase
MFFPLLYLGRHNIPIEIFPYVFQVVMIVVAILFILNINVKKLSVKAIVLFFMMAALIVLGWVNFKH